MNLDPVKTVNAVAIQYIKNFIFSFSLKKHARV